MLLEELQQRLRDPDQWVRVEALRILAMVEETRALSDIEWVYKNDPEPGVRQVAQWAGRIIYTYAKQANNQALSQVPQISRDEELLLSSIVEKDHRTYDLVQAQMQQQDLMDAARSRQTASPSLGPGDTRRREINIRANDDLMDLLDAGLSEGFFDESQSTK